MTPALAKFHPDAVSVRCNSVGSGLPSIQLMDKNQKPVRSFATLEEYSRVIESYRRHEKKLSLILVFFTLLGLSACVDVQDGGRRDSECRYVKDTTIVYTADTLQTCPAFITQGKDTLLYDSEGWTVNQ